MPILAALLGLSILVSIVWEGFETIILPRTVSRSLRLTRIFYRTSWNLWSRLGQRMPSEDGRRQLFMGIYGPLSLPVLLTLWATGLIVSFALLQWAQAHTGGAAGPLSRFPTDLYLSGVTFFTLGYGDVLPHTALAKFFAVVESGLGFGFLASVIGYLPVLYQSFSRREATISRLDARASSPSSSTELVRRFCQGRAITSLSAFLREWEIWASELLESHLSYPVLTYYRSQHEHQSWLSAMTTIMDTCTLIIVGVDSGDEWLPDLVWQARMTFAMARHAVVDLAYIFNAAPTPFAPDRLPPETLDRMRRSLAAVGFSLCDSLEETERLHYLRGLYEPYINALAQMLHFPTPAWINDAPTTDNWETSAWDHTQAHF